MIQPNDLRIGNLIEYRKRVVTVLEIRRKDFLVLDMGLEMVLHYGSEDVKWIAFSEEWLLKFGFKQWGSYKYLWKIKNISHFSINSLGETFRINEYNDYRQMNIEFVHQLQNICFSLTGKELEIKQ